MTAIGEGTSNREWDVFISYAREDYETAKALEDALRGCVTDRGGPPEVFLDREPGTIRPGADWYRYLEQSIAKSRYFVALFSPVYFTKDFCQRELHLALELSPPETGRVIPVVITRIDNRDIPFLARDRQYIAVAKPTWFDDLRVTMGLGPKRGARRMLTWDTVIHDIQVGNTLPEARITVGDASGEPVTGDGIEVTVCADPAGAGLLGRTTVPVHTGTALFTDLFFQHATDVVRLIATAPGCEAVPTGTFRVRAGGTSAAIRTGRDTTEFAGLGRPIFFPEGRSLATLNGDQLTVCTADGPSSTTTARLRARPRLWARGARSIAVADWSGQVAVCRPDGAIEISDLTARTGDRRLHVPGALAFAGDNLLVGMWNGEIWSLPGNGDAAQRIRTHSAGVQLLAANADRLLIGGTDGLLTTHTNMQASADHTYQLEPLLLGIVCGPGYALIVGEKQVYRLDTTEGKLLGDRMPVTTITGTLPGRELTAVIDADGQGVCFDAELRVRTGFHAAPGARPVAEGGGGRLLVFEYPDGRHALIADGRIEFTSANPLDVSRDGRYAALSDGGRIVVLPPSELFDVNEEPQ